MKSLSLLVFCAFGSSFILNSCNSEAPKKAVFETYESFNPVREFPKPADTTARIKAGAEFFQSALEGDVTKLEKMLQTGTDINSVDADGRTALMYAAYNGHTAVVKMLFSKGALADMKDVNGRTALMLAASGPFPASVKVLLDNQANPNLIDNEEHFTALMYAAAEGHLENVKMLLKYHADPSLKDMDGDNAMKFAADNGHSEVAAFLKSFIR